VLDGWWREGYNGKNGWAIGEDSDVPDSTEQDAKDARGLMDTLENEIIPLYYQDQSADSLPVEWLARVKESIRTLAPLFNTRRMVKEYLDNLYMPAMKGRDAPPKE
jgi:starch phosphorylase